MTGGLTKWQAWAPNATMGIAALAFLAFGAFSAHARVFELSSDQFQRWLQALQPRLLENGISRKTSARAFKGITLNKRILHLLTHQPEHSSSAGKYVSSLVSDRRVETGRDKLQTHRALLQRVSRRFGVDPTVVLAIWGVETSFGRIRGKSNTIRSLATLAASDQRRPKFWTKELIAALKILESRDVAVGNMNGSWAGAMGHTQFMPTTYHAYAVDFDGDGRRDIWNSTADALASTANYLKVSGWKTGQPWGFEVVLPKGFDFSLASARHKASLATWRARGILRARGPGWPKTNGNLSLVLPSGANGPAFLVTKNFTAIKRYNPSTLYALAVGQLSDAISGGPGLMVDWPAGDMGLTRTQRIELQTLLAQFDGNIGKPDGIIGRKTRSVIQRYQKSRGLPQDGHANIALLARLRLDSAATRGLRSPPLPTTTGAQVSDASYP